MSFLADLAADPKSLVARMRAGQVEPVLLRTAVSAIKREESDSKAQLEATAELQSRLFKLHEQGSLGRLSRRDLREGCKVVLHPPLPLAANLDVLEALFAQVEQQQRRAAFFATIEAYVDGFSPEDPAVLGLAQKLRSLSSRWRWRPTDQWPSRLQEFDLLDPTKAPEAIARAVLASGEGWRQLLARAGLDTVGRRLGGLMEAAFRYACGLVRRMRGQDAISGQRTLIQWAEDETKHFAYPRAWPAFVEASLTPWASDEPSDHHKRVLIDMLDQFGGGDPRSNPQRWRTIEEQAPAAYAVLLRWLTRASVLQFFDVVDRLMPSHEAKLMWAYRRAFWTSYLISDGRTPTIDAAWVAFGSQGANLANRVARESGDPSYKSFGRQQDKAPDQAALIIKMGDMTIVEWSHSAKYQVWQRGEKGAPKLFEKIYPYGALYSAPLQDSHVSPSTYSWQKRLAKIIEGKTYFSPKSAWKPKRA
ncbi:EH signature domain-containing protein [Sphingomonas sp. LY160]|uniref:EH signature domain-containing protein n=1 Tax=Sphingomonas sp. LY160 TaxID=3095342 RepID=UPI002ADEF8A4|nr:EH signature domain-containing protein [Sphingomonas sp. LY160]MEA1071740.1 EH signature domain-containing protein [Sphingomonas sp. LY160]